MSSAIAARASTGVLIGRTSMILCVLGCATLAIADEPSRLGRLFRFGTNSGSNRGQRPTPAPATLRDPASIPSAEVGPSAMTPSSEPVPMMVPMISADTPANPNRSRIMPQPRIGKPVTDADPLLTRIALGRSNEGVPFGMFLLVFADGTVIDSEGVHKLGRDAVKPIEESLGRGEIFKVKGHCGNPSTDFVEHVQLIVYDRRRGVLRAHSLSYTGNGQGCDHAVVDLQKRIDELQLKLARPGPTPAATSTLESSPPAMVTSRPANEPAAAPPIPLTSEPELDLAPIPR